jgi:hypothetical protein
VRRRVGGDAAGAGRWELAVVAPAVAIVVWALFVSENPTVERARPLQLVIKFAVFGAAAAALAATGQRNLAIAFAVVLGTLN